MSNNPLPLQDILTALPDEADYHAVYAALVATDRGRWFLNEFADRNRHADTHMLVGALARVEAAVRGDAPPQIPAVLAGEFSDLATAIRRIESTLALSGMPAADEFATAAAGAAQRIQDIAFALRERDVDTALCSALEAAIAELNDAFARRGAAAERAQGVAALLREVSGRVNALVAQAIAGAEPAETEPIANGAIADNAPVGATPLPQSSEAETREDESFAAAVGALAASFPVPDDACEPPSDAADAMLPASDQPASDGPVGDRLAPADAEPPPAIEPAEPTEPVAVAAELPDGSGGEAEAGEGVEAFAAATAPAADAAVPEPVEHPDTAADKFVGNEIGGDHAAGPAREAQKQALAAAENTPTAEQEDAASRLAAEPLPLPPPDSQAPAGLEEDLDDFFVPPPSALLPQLPDDEPAAAAAEIATKSDHRAGVADTFPATVVSSEQRDARADATPVAASASAAGTAKQICSTESPAAVLSSSTQATLPLEQALPPPRGIATPGALDIRRPAAGDPLAAVRALSEEELLALFS